MHNKTNFNATRFFELLTKTNKLTTSLDFGSCRVSGLSSATHEDTIFNNTAFAMASYTATMKKLQQHLD